MLYLEPGIVVVLIVINGLLSMSELAIVSLRPARLAVLVEKNMTGSRRALALASDSRTDPASAVVALRCPCA